MILEIVCENLLPFLRVIHYIINIIKIGVPVVLIVLVTFDIVKVITSGSNDFSKVKPKSFKRILYTLVICLVPKVNFNLK